MLDIGWSEMAVIALVALIVIGPKELPQAMRAASKWVRKARGLAREFQSGIDDMIREADLEDARKAVQTTQNFNLDKALEETVDPTGSVKDEARDLERTARDVDADGEGNRGQAAAGAAPDADDAATIIQHPLKIAPAHSLTPPPAEDAPADTVVAGGDGEHKRA